MSKHAIRAGAAAAEAAPGLAALRAELAIDPEYPAAALAEAEEAARRGPRPGARADARDVELVTLDPPSSMDLDQAFHLARSGSGYRVHYAIADVAAWVEPGGALDAETQARGLTVYGPDGRFGLHPPVLSEDAASLLPGVDRPAVLWRIDLDGDGVLRDIEVRRAWVRSRAKLDYAGVQRSLDDGTAEEMLTLLPVVGELRLDQQISRGGATLEVPEQEVSEHEGRYRLVYRAGLPVEEHNAQLSLLTGIAAARLQREAGVGIWRTLRPAREEDIARLRRVARGLGLDWPAQEPYGMFARTLTSTNAAHAAFATEATTLFRGAGYEPFGTPSRPRVPSGAMHSAIAAEYAHVTAPLRRLVDRYGTEVAIAQVAGTAVPDWVLAALDGLPDVMAAAAQRAGAYERGSVDLLEALIMAPRVGRSYDAMVVDATAPDDDGEARATVLLTSPAVRARVGGPHRELQPGTRTRVTVTAADPATRSVALELAAD